MTQILLVEDAHNLAQGIVRELEALGFQVCHAGDGRSALELHAHHPFDLIILDWMLPDIDGLEVLRQVRQTAPTPVLMLTARGEVVDRVIGLEVGADDYLTKPFNLRELVAHIRALLRRAEVLRKIVLADRDPAGDIVSYGDLRVDPVGHLATCQGVALDLSPSEFALLHLFLRNPGRAFSRAYLLDALWDAAYSSGDRSIDNSVLRLRKKLGSWGDAIETVWGIGYRLQPLAQEERA